MKKVLLLGAMLVGSLCAMAQPYFVAGSAENDPNGKFCNGQNWAAGAAENQMDANNTITFSGVAAGTYEFKVTNGTWDLNWGFAAVDMDRSDAGVEGADNVKITLPEEGDVTITFDAASEKIIVKSSVGFGALVIKTYTVLGDAQVFGSDWATGDEANDLTDNGDGTYSKTYENVGLDAGSYGFKVVGNHSYAAYEYPGSAMNKEIFIEYAALYNITIIFDSNEADDSEFKLTAEIEEVGEWEPTAVEDAIADDEVVAAYDLTGKAAAADAKGVVILQYKSGKAVKVIND